jgi:site-specific recombinase XerD
MDRDTLSPLLRSFERNLRAENRSEHTIASYLGSLRQAEAFLASRSRSLIDARREDLEAFLGDLLRPSSGRSLAPPASDAAPAASTARSHAGRSVCDPTPP